MKGQDLFCWFNTLDSTKIAHVSLEISTTHNVWQDFHITYPVLHKEGWDDKATQMSYSIHYRINGGSIE
jgi:hypothetical protein